MKHPFLAVLPIAVALVSGCGHRARTYPYVWQLRGAVVSMSGTEFRVRHKSGQVVDLRFDDQTAFEKNKQPGSSHLLLRGSRVMVDVETLQRAVYRARRVQVLGGGRPWQEGVTRSNPASPHGSSSVNDQ